MIDRLESKELLLSGLMNQMDNALDKLRLYNVKGKGYWEELINTQYESKMVKQESQKTHFGFFNRMNTFY